MLQLITAAQRLANRHVNIAIFGASGVGKTTQARTLDPKTTLFIDLESGTLSLSDWAGDVIDVRKTAQGVGADPWEITRALALYIGGHDPSDATGDYSKEAYDGVAEAMKDLNLAKYETIFIDSVTVASRWCLAWAMKQPEAWSEKKQAKDTMGAYGLLGREMIKWLTHLQHAPKNIVVVGILEQDKDEFGRVEWAPQIEGSATGKKMPGIWDEVMTLAIVEVEDGKKERKFVCQFDNQWGYPAKSRSSLSTLEEANLGKLINKIRGTKEAAKA